MTPDTAQKPLVTAISSYYNRQDHVTASVRSLLDQTYDNMEVIVIDDGSSDGTYAELCALRHPRLTVMRTENQGLAGAYRTVISRAKGDLIAVHDAGDISLPERIEKQVALLDARPEVGVVGCHVDNVNLRNNTSLIYKPKLEQNMTERLKRGSVFTHGEVMFRRELYERVGGYRTFFKYAQDRDLWLRMSLHTRFAVVEEVLYKRLIFPDGVELDLEKSALQGFFADFAGQCLESRDEAGRDLVDCYGVHAPFFRKRSLNVAKRLQRLSNYALLREDVPLARRLNHLSVQEVRGLQNTLVQGVLALASSTPAAANALLYLLLKARDVKRSARPAANTQPN